MWVSSEIARGEVPSTKESDVFALGVTIWEALSRERPHIDLRPEATLLGVAQNAFGRRP